MSSKKVKYFNNNKISLPKLEDKNKLSSKSFISQDNANLIGISSRKVSMSFLDEFMSLEYEKEDQRITAEYFKVITIDELINCMFLLMTLGSCFIYNETKICFDDCLYNEEIKNDIINISLIFSSITTFFFISILVIKYYHYFLLYKNAKYIQPYSNFF